MPWDTVKLADGRAIPSIAFGTAHAAGDAYAQVDQALEVGFDHIDTAQNYGNEEQTGSALHSVGIDRKDVFVTTKWSHADGKGIRESFKDSLTKLNTAYIDLYLIHNPRWAVDGVVAAWQTFLELKKEGHAKSVGVSNFGIEHLEALRQAGLETPVVNQIQLHPYVYEKTKPLLAYHATHGIVTEAYSPLVPITKQPNGPLDAPLSKIAEAHGVDAAAVLLAWARTKAGVVITTSSRRDRLNGVLKAGDLKLTEAEIETIDHAGKQSYLDHRYARRLGAICLLAIGFFLFGTFVAKPSNLRGH